MYSRQIDYFISVAEYLNFTKAAKHHFMAQTAMSQQIRVLEKKLGVDLFIRNNRSVQLTPAGRIFLQEAKRIVAISDEAIKKARHAASGFVGTLKIGFLGPNEKRFLPDLVKKFRHDYPNIILSFKQGNAETIRSDLEHGLLDIAFTMAFDLDQTPGLIWETLYTDPICVIMHRDHPLANEAKINPVALAHEPFVAMEHREYPGAVERMIQFCITRGFTPNIVSQHAYLETVLLMVEAGIGVTLLPRFFDTYSNPNLRFIDLAGDTDYVYSVATWKKDYTNPSIPIFLKELGITVADKPTPKKKSRTENQKTP
ncbi:MAG: transcriptional regulator AlsR family [Firmicutes bacterium]|nr:transcriptional regulator AlsR family [Bacillota bacterium]